MCHFRTGDIGHRAEIPRIDEKPPTFESKK